MENLRELYQQSCTWFLEASSTVFQFVIGLFTNTDFTDFTDTDFTDA